MEINKRYAVFSIRRQKNGSIWTRAGSAWMNRDGSMNLYLDVLPLDGTLHVREAADKREVVPESRPEAVEQHEQLATGGH